MHDRVLSVISRNSAVFYWKSTNLIGSPSIFYSRIENGCAHVDLTVVFFFLNFSSKIHNIVGFGLQSFRVYTCPCFL